MFSVGSLLGPVGGNPENGVVITAVTLGTVGYLTSRVVNRLPLSFIGQLSPQSNALFQMAATLAGLWCVKKVAPWIDSAKVGQEQKTNAKLLVRVSAGYALGVAALKYGAQLPINHRDLLVHTLASSLVLSFVYRPFAKSLV